MPIGTFDLSIVTDALIALLNDCVTSSPLWHLPDAETFVISVSGSAPDAVRKEGGCQLSVYLYQVNEDRFQKNNFWAPQAQRAGVPPVRFEPLCLDLYYLITAFADRDYHQEQRAMSIAMRCLHDHPIIVIPPQRPGDDPEELSLSIEPESADELSRLWQASTSAYRMSAIYRVSVAFVTPEDLPPSAPHPTTWTLVADPAALPDETAQLIGTRRRVRYRAPPVPHMPDERAFDLSPATAAPGQSFALVGGNLQTAPGFDGVYLVDAAGLEQSITGWKTPPPAPQTDTVVTLTVPAGGPDAGVYQVRVGSDPEGQPPVRSNATVVSLAAAVTPAPAPVIAPEGGRYTIHGSGFISGHTEVLLETVLLQEGAAGEGTFAVDPSGTDISFGPPAGLPSGRYAVRVRVNGVESDPGIWIST